MIKQLEIKNFESHEHSVFEFTKGLNAITGLSDSGKTAVVRAFKLVTQNQWDKKSLRIGTKKAEVTLTTDKGSVKVIRSKTDNIWEVKPRKGKIKTFEKIGKNVPEEALNIIGMRPIELAGKETLVNIMNQLEGHFMLSNFGSDNATGSARAQVIDEISGLSGMEDLVKRIGLDNLRRSKRIRELEENNAILEEKKYDEKKLEMLGVDIKRCEELEEKISFLEANLERADSMSNQIEKMHLIHDECEVMLRELPKVDEDKLKEVEDFYDSLVDIQVFSVKYKNRKENIKKMSSELGAIGDINKVSENIESVNDEIVQMGLMCNIVGDMDKRQGAVNDIKGKLSDMEDTSEHENSINELCSELNTINAMAILSDECVSAKETLDNINISLKENKKDIKKYDKEVEEMLETITLCPLTLNPIGKDCK